MDLNQCLSLANEAAQLPTQIEVPDATETEALLAFAGAVAHASERKAAPVATYAVGAAWAGVDAAERIRRLRAATAAIDAAAAPDTDAGTS